MLTYLGRETPYSTSLQADPAGLLVSYKAIYPKTTP